MNNSGNNNTKSGCKDQPPSVPSVLGQSFSPGAPGEEENAGVSVLGNKTSASNPGSPAGEENLILLIHMIWSVFAWDFEFEGLFAIGAHV
ncbi:myosin d [Anopheles sinensis]|uniref:Myosin d n=1 Tax=Anopheles sinensis TaxID=74873 RepID=A0A084WQI2_ANOSI|nr:myosin d [Anopheles sinensis]